MSRKNSIQVVKEGGDDFWGSSDEEDSSSHVVVPLRRLVPTSDDEDESGFEDLQQIRPQNESRPLDDERFISEHEITSSDVQLNLLPRRNPINTPIHTTKPNIPEPLWWTNLHLNDQENFKKIMTPYDDFSHQLLQTICDQTHLSQNYAIEMLEWFFQKSWTTYGGRMSPRFLPQNHSQPISNSSSSSISHISHQNRIHSSLTDNSLLPPNLPSMNINQSSSVYGDPLHYEFDICYLSSTPILMNSALVPTLELDYEHEVFRSLVAEHKENGRIYRYKHFIATPEQIRDIFTRRSRIVHYSGHAEQQGLILEKKNRIGKGIMFGNDELETLIQEVRTQDLDDESMIQWESFAAVELVVLCACHSLPTAQKLVQCGVKHVVCVGAEKTIPNDVAQAFMTEFYKSLLLGRTVREAFEIGRKTCIVKQHDESKAKLFKLLPELSPENPNLHDRYILIPSRDPSTVKKEMDVRFSGFDINYRFYKREKLLYEIIGHMTNENSVLAIDGSQGTGKTSLVVEACTYIKKRHAFKGYFRFDFNQIYRQILADEKLPPEENREMSACKMLAFGLLQEKIISREEYESNSQSTISFCQNLKRWKKENYGTHDLDLKEFRNSRLLFVIDNMVQLKSANDANSVHWKVDHLEKQERISVKFINDFSEILGNQIKLVVVSSSRIDISDNVQLDYKEIEGFETKKAMIEVFQSIVDRNKWEDQCRKFNGGKMTTSVEDCLMEAPILEYIHKGGRKPGMINAVDIIFKKNGLDLSCEDMLQFEKDHQLLMKYAEGEYCPPPQGNSTTETISIKNIDTLGTPIDCVKPQSYQQYINALLDDAQNIFDHLSPEGQTVDTRTFVGGFLTLNSDYFFGPHILDSVSWEFSVKETELTYIKNKQYQKRRHMDWQTYRKWLEEWGALLGCLLSLGPTYNHDNSIFHGWISKKESSRLLYKGLEDETIPSGAGICIIRGSSKDSSIVICVKVKGSKKDVDHYLLRVEMLRQQGGQYRLMANRSSYFPFPHFSNVFLWIHQNWKLINYGLTCDGRIIPIEEYLKILYTFEDDDESPYFQLAGNETQ